MSDIKGGKTCLKSMAEQGSAPLCCSPKVSGGYECWTDILSYLGRDEPFCLSPLQRPWEISSRGDAHVIPYSWHVGLFLYSFPPHLKERGMAQGLMVPADRLSPGVGLPGGEQETGLLAGMPQTLPQLQEGHLLSKDRAGGDSCLFFTSLAGRQLRKRRRLCSEHLSTAVPVSACTGEVGSNGKRWGKSPKEQFPTSSMEVNAWAWSTQVSESHAKKWSGGVEGNDRDLPGRYWASRGGVMPQMWWHWPKAHPSSKGGCWGSAQTHLSQQRNPGVTTYATTYEDLW